MTGDRVYNIVKARNQSRKDTAQEAQQRKEQRLEKAREASRALAAEGEALTVKGESDLEALTRQQLQAWLLLKDPGAWDANKKLKTKQQLRDAALALYRKLACEP